MNVPPLPAEAARMDPATGLPASATGSFTSESAVNAAFKTDNEVRQLISAGQYDEALQGLLAFHDPTGSNWAGDFPKRRRR